MRSWSNTIDAVSFCEVITEFLMEHPSPNGPSAPVERAPLLSIPRKVCIYYPHCDICAMQYAFSLLLFIAQFNDIFIY